MDNFNDNFNVNDKSFQNHIKNIDNQIDDIYKHNDKTSQELINIKNTMDDFLDKYLVATKEEKKCIEECLVICNSLVEKYKIIQEKRDGQIKKLMNMKMSTGAL